MPQAYGRVMSNADLLLFAVQNGGLIDAQDVGAGGADNPLLSGQAPAGGSGAGPRQRLTFGNGLQLVVYQGQSGQWIVEPDSWQAAQSQGPKSESDLDRRMAEAQLEGQQLSNEKARQSLSGQAEQPGSMESAFRDLDKTLTYLQQKYSQGLISYEEMSAAAKKAKTAFSDTLAGSTAFQRQKASADYRTANADRGAAMLNQRVGSGSSLINSLLGNTMDAVKLGVGPGSFDPGKLAQEWVTNLGGGQANYDAASQMLQGAIGAGSPDVQDPTNPAYWYGSPDNPGDPGVQDDEQDGVDSQLIAAGLLPGGTGSRQERYINGIPEWAAGSAGGY